MTILFSRRIAVWSMDKNIDRHSLNHVDLFFIVSSRFYAILYRFYAIFLMTVHVADLTNQQL